MRARPAARRMPVPELAFDRRLNWVLDKLEATKAVHTEQDDSSQPELHSLGKVSTFGDLMHNLGKVSIGARLLTDEKEQEHMGRFLQTLAKLRFSILVLTLFLFLVCIVLLGAFGVAYAGVIGVALGAYFVAFRALEIGEYDGQQWRKGLVIFVKLVAYMGALASPLGTLFIVYGQFLGEIAGQRLPESLQVWNRGFRGLLVAVWWFMSCWAVVLVAEAEACAVTHLFSWPGPCKQLFCNDFQLRDLGVVAASFAAAAAFYIHCLSWWHGSIIPLPTPLTCCRWPMFGLPVLVGFCFLHISQPEKPLEHFLFAAGCLAFVGICGKCARLIDQSEPPLQAWQVLLVSLMWFAAFGVAVSTVRIMSADQDMLQMNPPGMFAACIIDDSGACSVTPPSTIRTAQHARFFLLATTAFPACCGLAWKALRPNFPPVEAAGDVRAGDAGEGDAPDTGDAVDDGAGHDWLIKLLVSALTLGVVGSLWGFSIFREESDPLAAEVLFFLLAGLLSCFLLRQLHWRAYFWVKFQRDPATAKNPYQKFIVAEFDPSKPVLRRHRVSQPALVTGNRAKVLHLQKPLQGWPSFWDIPSRMDAVAMSMQSTVAPFYHLSSWRRSMSELSNKCNNVPFLSHDDVVLLSRISLVFLIGKVCLLALVMLAPLHFSDTYLRYNEAQDVVEDMYDHVLSLGDRKNSAVDSYASGFVRILYLWWIGNSELYRDLFIAVATACIALAACWRWTGIFSLLASCLHALALFVVVDAELRKVIILRDAELAGQCWFGAIGLNVWFQRACTFLGAFGVPAFVQAVNLNLASRSRNTQGHIVVFDLLANTLLPPPANVLLVSAANLPYSIQLNDCLLDLQIYRFAVASATTVVTFLTAPGAATMSDIVSFAAQAVLKLKGPFDAYAVRLKRIGAIARALSESHPVDYEPLTFEDAETCPQMRYFSDMPAWWCAKVRFYEVMSAANVGFIPQDPAQTQRSKKRLTSATLGGGEEVHIEVGQDKVWATSRLLRRRLAVSIQFTEPSLWAFWTLEVCGHRTCYRTFLG